MSASVSAAVLLQAWLSPAFPTGAFAYSHALEQAHADGELDGRDALVDWLRAHLEHGSLYNDLCLVSLTWHAAADLGRAAELNALAVALAGGAERRLETTAQGSAFLRAIAAAWSTPACARGVAPLADCAVALPCAVAICAAGHAIPILPLLEAYAFAWLANAVSAAARLGAIGHTDAQRALAALAPELAPHAQAAVAADEGMLGGCAFRSEIQALRHETLYTRLFRT